MSAPFTPCVALASLSGESDAAWARAGVPHAGAAFLGGIAVDEPTRAAARNLHERDRSEFLPADPLDFLGGQLDALSETPIKPGINVRAATPDALEGVAKLCADTGAILEINAHCRQEEMCRAGAGESLLQEPERCCRYVEAAASLCPEVSVKVRTEVPGVDLGALAAKLDNAGATMIHVDAMDTESVIRAVTAGTECAVIANNGVRDRESVHEYLSYGADAVSVGRPSDDPRVLERVSTAVSEWFNSECRGVKP